MTRVAAAFAIACVLLPSPAAAQQAVFVEAVAELTRTMLLSTADVARANAAIGRMETALERWQPQAASGDELHLGDEAATTPALPLAAYAEGFLHIRRGEYREAIASLRRAAAVSVDERSELAAAGRLSQQGLHVEAEQRLRAIVTARPSSAVARWWLARVYENLNRIGDAREEYEKVVPVALTGRATLYASIGRLAHFEGNFARANHAFEERLRLTPNDPVAHKDLAWVHLDQDQTDAALEALGRVVALDPRDFEAHAGIGRIRLEAGRHAEAIVALQRALVLKPTLHEARYALALALKRSGRDEEAAKEMELFERGRREATEERRRTMATDVQRQEEKRAR